MQIKRIPIDINFPAELINKINIFNSVQEFSSIWQTIEWNMTLQRTNYIKEGYFIGVFDNEELINFVITEKRLIGFGKYANFVIGGLFNNCFDLIEKELARLGEETKVIFTQIESLSEIKYNLFIQGTYKKFIEKCTAYIDLKDDKESILSRMKPKGRYNIKVAEKHGVQVNKVENSIENLDKFYNLLSETKERDEFSINSKDYFQHFLAYLYDNNIGGLYFATKDEELIAAGIFVFYNNTAYYYYGASTTDNNKRKYMATYLLQWRLIEESKEIGMKNYDFLGINCPGCESKKLAGVTDFKLKLTSQIKIWPNSYIYIHNKSIFLFFRLKNFLKKLVGKH